MLIVDDLLIAAEPRIVWEVTVDVENLPHVTPTMTSVELLGSGPPAVGSRVRVAQPRQWPAVWVVTRCDEPTDFAWERPLPGGRMVASHHLATAGGGTWNRLEVEFHGLGARMVGALIGRSIRAAIRTENRGIRRCAEALASGTPPRPTTP